MLTSIEDAPWKGWSPVAKDSPEIQRWKAFRRIWVGKRGRRREELWRGELCERVKNTESVCVSPLKCPNDQITLGAKGGQRSQFGAKHATSKIDITLPLPATHLFHTYMPNINMVVFQTCSISPHIIEAPCTL